MATDKNPYGKISKEFAVGRIRVLESTLLSQSDFSAIIEANGTNEALRILRDTGYGSSEASSKDDLNLELLINNELTKTNKTIASLSPDNELTELFLLDIDAHNFKVYLKAKITSEDTEPLIMQGGTVSPELMRVCVETEDYSLLSDTFIGNIKGIDKLLSPRIISTEVDKAMYTYIFDVLAKNKNKFIREYFSKKVNLINRNTILRALKLNYSEKDISSMLIGEANIKDIDATSGVSLIDSEREMNKQLLNKLRDQKADSFSIAPVICFLMDKRNEALNLRLIFAAKQSGENIGIKDLDL